MHAAVMPKTFGLPATESLETLVDKVTDLLSLPDAAMRLNELLADPDAAHAEIAEVVAMDPALAARVLRAVNSAAFGLHGHVDTVSKAIVMIGTSELHTLVLATSAAQAFRSISTKLMDMESFWQHSVRAALAASGLAGASRHSERVFLSALMHDIGKLVVYHQFPAESTRILEAVRAGRAQDEAEKAALGFSHADVGALLLERWNLPAALAVPVRFHHRHQDAVEFGKEAALLHLGDQVAHLMDADTVIMEPSMLEVTPEVWDQAECSPVEVDQVMFDVNQHWFEVMEIVAPSSMLLY